MTTFERCKELYKNMAENKESWNDIHTLKWKMTWLKENIFDMEAAQKRNFFKMYNTDEIEKYLSENEDLDDMIDEPETFIISSVQETNKIHYL